MKYFLIISFFTLNIGLECFQFQIIASTLHHGDTYLTAITMIYNVENSDSENEEEVNV